MVPTVTPSTGRFATPDASLRRMASDWAIRGVSAFGSVASRIVGPRTSSEFGILLYHRIAKDCVGIAKPTINVPPHRFEAQIRGLVEAGYVFWPLRRVVDVVAAGKPIPPYVTVLTFDDGFAGVYEHAWPVLRELNVPATVFLATAYLGSDSPFPFDHWGKEFESKVPARAYRPLTIDECDEMYASGLIEFGAHTHTHEDFRGRVDEFRRDLETNLRRLEELFSLTDVHFAFPYGTPRLGFADPDLMEAAVELGVQSALTTHSSLVRSADSPFGWGRFTAFPWDHAGSLAAKLGGWYGWAPELKNRLLGRSAAGATDRLMTRDCCCGHAPANDRECGQECPSGTSSACPRISIVVPTFNRSSWLRDALNSLVKQRTDGQFTFDIVVCDNASTDDTAQVVADVAHSSDVPIHYCQETKPGDAPTRNRALQHTTGDWIAFFDDDQLAPQDWLSQLYCAAMEADATIVGGAVHLELTDEERATYGDYVCKALRETKLYDQLHPYIHGELPGTGNALVKRSIFQELGTFDEAFVNGGSDFDFFSRAKAAGVATWYTPDAIIRHRVDPMRMKISHLRLDALSGGAEHAEQIDFKQRGIGRVVTRGIARLGQASLVHMPLMIVSWLNQDRGAVLGRRIRLWRTEGYLRKCVSLMMPRFFPQRRFFDSMTFRHGRPDTSNPS